MLRKRLGKGEDAVSQMVSVMYHKIGNFKKIRLSFFPIDRTVQFHKRQKEITMKIKEGFVSNSSSTSFYLSSPTIDLDSIVGSFVVWNPKFKTQETIDLLNLKLTKDEFLSYIETLEQKDKRCYEKLKVLVDRIEFIKHLQTIQQQLFDIPSDPDDTNISSYDEINALRLYLALTCIDLFAGLNWKKFTDWIIDGDSKDSDTIKPSNEIVDSIKSKIKDYQKDHGTGNNFRKALSRSDMKTFFEANLGIVEEIGRALKIDQTISSIVSTLYKKVRTGFTHDGQRFFFKPNVQCEQVQHYGGKSPKYFQVMPNVDIVEMIVEIAKQNACEKLRLNRDLNIVSYSCVSAPIDPKSFVKPINKSNKNLEQDILKILGKKATKDSLDALKKEKNKEFVKIAAFIDRIKFIRTLDTICLICEKNKYSLNGHEVEGIKNDIRPLQLYLALTCVDMFCDNIYFIDWLKDKNSNITEEKISLKDYLTQKQQEYKKVSRSENNYFIGSFTNSEDKIRTDIEKNLKVYKDDREYSDIGTIAEFLHQIRNKYTHESIRFQYLEKSPLPQHATIGDDNTNFLRIEPRYNLIEAVIDVAIAKAVSFFSKKNLFVV